MLKISPKVIDVEGNRIHTDDKLKPCELVDFRNKLVNEGDKMNLGASGLKRETLKDGRGYIPSENGRFPTQLFTNNKKELFKYVKQVD